MLIVMKSDATDGQIETVLRVIEELGFKGHPMPGATRTAIGITGNQGAVDPSHFENLAGVAEAIRVSKPYKLISLDLRPEKTVVRVGDAAIGGDELAIIAGPCAIESRAQAFAIAEAVRRSGARFFRGGAYKPRTSPYAFQGLGEEGLRILADVREAYGLKIVTEALDEAGVDLVERYGDMIQIGARNMQNFSLLRRAGRAKLPILLKRGLSATLDEWLLAARGSSVQRYPWGNTAAACEQHGSVGTQSMGRCKQGQAEVGKVEHHPAGASPSGMQDILLTPGELLQTSDDALFSVCRASEDAAAGTKRACVVYGLRPGAIDSVRGLTATAEQPDRSSSAYGFRCTWGGS